MEEEEEIKKPTVKRHPSPKKIYTQVHGKKTPKPTVNRHPSPR